jgi:hypothetical protein
MTSRTFVLGLALALSVAACSDKSTSPSSNPNQPKFSAGLLASNENPPVTNADSGGTGTVTVTMNLTKDAGGTITDAPADFTVQLQGFPAGTVLTGAHIHPGPVGVNGGVIWNLALGAGEIVLANGSTTFTKTAVRPTDLVTAQAIINNPAGFYFNVHTQVNPGGAVRGQLASSN